MRKTVFICISIVLLLCFLLIVNFGLNLGFTKILSYDEIEEANINKKILLSEFDEKVNNDFKNEENEYIKIVDEYKKNKNEYEKMVESRQIDNDFIQQYLNIYNIEDVSEILDNYAKEKNVEIRYSVNNSNTFFAINSKYIMCDISFYVKGEYIDITDFIYSIEDDDRLNFEISDFELKSVNDVLEANFNVKNVPILNQGL